MSRNDMTIITALPSKAADRTYLEILKDGGVKFSGWYFLVPGERTPTMREAAQGIIDHLQKRVDGMTNPDEPVLHALKAEGQTARID